MSENGFALLAEQISQYFMLLNILLSPNSGALEVQ